MKAVNVAELKNRLSHYLRLVRRGQPILVRDRDRVIARIEPAGGQGMPVDDESRRLEDLEARGIVRRGRGRLTRQLLLRRPKVQADVVRGPAARAGGDPLRFWDSSALVPLLVQRPASSEVERWMADDASLVLRTLTPVEIVSALRRLVREGLLPERAACEADSLASGLVRRTHVVADVERVKVLATRLLRLQSAPGRGRAPAWRGARVG